MEHATTTIILSVLRGNDLIVLSALQKILAPYTPLIIRAWTAVWCITVVCLLWVLYHEWRKDRADR